MMKAWLFLKQPMQLKNESLSFPFIYRFIGLYSDGFISPGFKTGGDPKGIGSKENA